ncbi:uncharacterized protein LOC119631802 [Glossina fuscipes]|uniref:U5 small nuclear ribonucleoprotein TSSC4 n=2 Tax=Nemorhina TaxID=44051 RepID=A0A8U0W4V4_9MUSC|nr:uncharacterized protein LOC119631802 [Glossina fuscipes]
MQDFITKRNALFACLDDASNELKGTSLDQTNSLMALEDSKRLLSKYKNGLNIREISSEKNLKHLRGKESIFKKPELPINKCLKPRKIPDYRINPHKWKKYSLTDIDISDHTNTTAALAFLQQMDKQRELQQSDNEKFDVNTKIEFKKSSKIERELKILAEKEVADVEVDLPKLKGSKLIMPEYVVGQTIKKTKTKRNYRKCLSRTKEHANGQLLLTHLQEEGEECEVDNCDSFE